MGINAFLTGCSFLASPRWSFIEQDKNFENKKIDYFPGGGNNIIVANLLQRIIKNKYDFVFVSFSGFDRDDFLIDKECESHFDYHCHSYDLMNNMWIHSGGFGASYQFEDKQNIFKSRYKFGFNDIHQILINCNLILTAQTILKNLNIPYIFCFYSNQLEVKNFAVNQSYDGKGLLKREYVSIKNYKAYIPCLELIDWDKFWFYENVYSKYCGLEEYAYDLGHDYLLEDQHHPTEKANYKFWYEEIIPLYNNLYCKR